MNKFPFQEKPYYYSAGFAEASTDGDIGANLAVYGFQEDLNVQKELLEKILGAVGSSTASCCIYHFEPSQMYNWNLISSGHTEIISFGVTPNILNFHIQFDYFKTIVLEKKRFLVSHSLKEVSNSVEYKKQLWASLKKDFN